MILGKLKPLRESIEEWNGKTVVASVNGFKIAVDDAHAVSYITAWSDDNHCVGKLYTRRTPDKIGKEYLSIELVEVEKKYRGNGIALALFRSLIEHMAPKWKGISSYLPDQVNKKQISYIFSKLGGYEIDDYMMVDR
jgi:ribosomal protein S18 acetylase RimI-like enzyme